MPDAASERLKSLKTLQQMLCVAAAAVLAFAMTPDRSKEYRAGLGELEALRRLSLKTYPAFVQDRFRQQKQANCAFIIKAARHATINIEGTPICSQPIVMDGPPQIIDLRLKDYEEFILSNHMAAIAVVDHNEREFAEELKTELQKIDRPVALTGISIAQAGTFYSWEGVAVVDPVTIPNSATDRTTVQLYLSTTLPPAPVTQPIPVTFRFEEIKNAPLAMEWLRSQELAKDLIDTKSGILFPNLKPFWERIGAMGIDNAALFLQERIEATARGTLTLFGVSIDRDLILWAGPTLCVALLLFLCLHLRHFLSIFPIEKISEINGYPWIACFDDSLSAITTYCAIVVLPLAACMLLLLKHGQPHDWSTRSGICLTFLVLLFACLCAAYLYTFRLRLFAKKKTLRSGGCVADGCSAEETAYMRRRLLDLPVALALFLLAALGCFAVWWFWPSRESESAKAQAIAALLGFLSSVLIASITWIYVRTTQEMLALQRKQQEAYRPKITIASDWTSFVINGPIDNHQNIQFTASWRAYFSNESLTTSTTIRILRAVLIGVPQQTLIRAYFQAANNANATNIRKLEPGETSALLLVAEFKLPNLNDAQPPEPAHFKFELADIFTGNLATPELEANVQ